MEIYISINGVLRNFIQKFEYHYKNYFLDTELIEDDTFEYGIDYPIQNDDLQKYFRFQSKEEFDNFRFIEFPLELFGHSGISYQTAISDLNKMIYEHKDINFTLVGINELGKAKPSTFFFLSRNGFLGNNVKFITSNDIENEWKKCDIWISDDKEILEKCPKNKWPVKFTTDYNQHFTIDNEINNLIKINELCSKYSEKNTTSMLTKLLENVVQTIKMKTKNTTKVAI